MKDTWLILVLALLALTACKKSSAPNAPSDGSSSASSSMASSKSPDAVQVKLQEYAGGGASDCGRLDIKASQDQLKSASDCALQSSQNKRPFYVGYDMPGMAVGVAGNSEGKLFTIQAQGSGAVTAGSCPSQLRVASSGRVTCFAPGDMGSMSGSHAAGTMAPGAANPHSAKPANHP